jgi:very-short-patch-repair endonuclease
LTKNPEIVRRARELRKSGTRVEELLWKAIRSGQLGGYKFRRQHPIGDFVADFYCAEMRLIIEIDGGRHDELEVHARDEARTKMLEATGHRVVRIANEEILNGLQQVLRKLMRELPPHPLTPSPRHVERGQASGGERGGEAEERNKDDFP